MIQIAIDGPSGAGKSSLAKRLAKELGYVYVDTGALYRAIAFALLAAGADIADENAVLGGLAAIHPALQYVDGVQHVLVNGQDVSGKIRTEEVSMAASRVSAYPGVRNFLTETQRAIARENNVLMDGRDIGTVILPNAQIKIFLTASAEERARRRTQELQQKGQTAVYEEVLADIRKRDYNDSHRDTAPLRQAPDAVLVDTTGCEFEEAYEKLYTLIKGRLPQ